MPIIHANIIAGRSEEAKTGFARAVTNAAVEHLGVTAAQVRVLLHEIPAEHWVVGGVPKSRND